MFKCQKCEQSPFHLDADGKRVGGRPIRVVTERKMVNHLQGMPAVGPRNGMGSQIVKEISVCAACLSSTPEAPMLVAEPAVTTTKIAPGITLNSRIAEDYAR